MGICNNLLARAVRRALETPRRGLPKFQTNTNSFDRDWGTKTSGIVWLTNPHSKNFIYGIRYEPCNAEACKWAIDNVGIDTSRLYFIDVGCGKGRPLLIASR